MFFNCFMLKVKKICIFVAYNRMTMNNEIYDFYNNGAEIGRLERGLGLVEFHRMKEILSSRFPSIICGLNA